MTSPTPNRTTFWFLVGMSLYFCVQAGSRIAISPSAHLDESEQVLLTQSLQWGYGPQPPLYTWLQWLVFTVTGASVFGLSLLKNLLLFTLFTLGFFIAKRATGSARGGVLGALALAFLPDVAWEAQRDLTHSVLAAVFGLAVLWALLRVAEKGTLLRYLVLGLAFGLGCLSKYNFALGAVSLVIAAFTLPEARRAMLSWRAGCGLLAAVLVVAPHGVWILGHQGLATATAGKLKSLSDAGNSPFANFFELAVLLMGAVGPALLVFGIASWRRAGMSASASSLLKRLVGRQFLIAGALLVICILVFRITEFRARWFLPLIIGAPLLLVAWAWPRLNESRIRALTILGMAILAAVAALLPGRILFAEKLGRIEPLHRPFAELAGPIASRVAEGGVVLAESRLIGGNLRLAGLKSPVVSPDTWNVIPHPQGPVLLVWDATAQPQPSERFIRNLAKLGLQLGSPPESFEAVCLHHSSRTYRLAISLATPSPPSE